MKFGLDVATSGEWADPRRLVDLARAADASGWDGFFLWDIFLPEDDAPVADPWTTLGAIADATSRIRIGAMVTPLPRRQPWEVARSLVTLDHLSGGRAVLGAGLGWRDDELRRLGLAADLPTRVERLEEGLEIVERLWSGDAVTFAGRHHSVAEVRTLPRPVQRPRIPIWLAVGWPRTRPLRRALSWDGAYLMTEHQVTHERLTPSDVRAVAEIVGRERSRPGFEIAVNVFTPDEPHEGRAITAAMAEAGATWTVELSPETFTEHLDLVRRGPARERCGAIRSRGRSRGRAAPPAGEGPPGRSAD